MNPSTTTSNPSSSVSATFLGQELRGGRYLIQEKISQGGSAWLFRARHTTLNEPMALKILYPQFLENESVRHRFLEEARIQFRLRHQNIVHITDVIHEEHCLGSVMEWVEGEDLRAYMRRHRGPVPLKAIETILLPIIRALHYVHQEGVVHRDIKPANILLQRQGHDFLPKLTDFGIAKVLFAESNTMTGSTLGTVTYMAPEQINDAKHVTPGADVYSLGVLLFQMLTGQTPFRGNPQQQLMKHLSNAPPSPRSIQPSISTEMDRLVLWCMEKKPEDRPDSCEVLLVALHDALKLDTRSTLMMPPIVPLSSLPTDTGEESGLSEPGINTDLEMVLDHILDSDQEAGGQIDVDLFLDDEEDFPTTMTPPEASNLKQEVSAESEQDLDQVRSPHLSGSGVAFGAVQKGGAKTPAPRRGVVGAVKLTTKAAHLEAKTLQVLDVVDREPPRSMLLGDETTPAPAMETPSSNTPPKPKTQSLGDVPLVRLGMTVAGVVLGLCLLLFVWRQVAPSATIILHEPGAAQGRTGARGSPLFRSVKPTRRGVKAARVCFDITPGDTSFHFKVGKRKRFRRGSFCIRITKPQRAILWRYGFHGCEFDLPLKDATYPLWVKAKHIKLPSSAQNYCVIQ